MSDSNVTSDDTKIILDRPVIDANTDAEQKVYSEHEENSSHENPGDSLPFPMATSLQELEVAEELSERTGILKRLAKRFQMIMSNIISNPLMTPDDKVDALDNLTGEMQTRVRGTLETREASDKQVTKREAGADFPAGDFADVSDSEKPSTWKLRLAEDRPGNITVAQVARAITALQPSGFRGQRVQLGSPKPRVISRISTAIGKTGGTDEQKANLKRRLSAVKELRSGFKVLKALDGTPRWLGWVTNNRMDRELEILTEKAHVDYMTWLDQNPQAAPELWTWHIPGTSREKRADFWAYLNGFVLMGGELTEQEAKAFDNISDLDLAMSHGFFVLDKQSHLINQYRTSEVTVLPRAAAANPWTEFTTLKELSMEKLTDEQRQVAIALHGEEFVAALEQETADKTALLDKMDVQSKEQDAKDDLPETEEKTDDGAAIQGLASEVAKMVIKELDPKGLQAALKSVHDLGQQNATAIGNITTRLEAIEKSDDEKVAEQFEPGINWNAGFRATQDKETIVKEDDKILEAKPDWNWVENLDPTSKGAAQ